MSIRYLTTIPYRTTTLLGALRDAAMCIRHRDDLELTRWMIVNDDPMNLCTDFDVDGCPTPAGIADAQAFVARARNWTPLAWRLWELTQNVNLAARIIACGVIGHNLHDAGSHAGPDSGAEHVVCHRCGWSWSHTYY